MMDPYRSSSSYSSASASASSSFMDEVQWRKEQDRQFDPDKVAKSNADTDYGIKTYKETLKKGDKDTFYCILCKVELNSRETRQSHLDGAKHQRKLDMECRTQRERDDAIVRIADPPDVRKKVPETLAALLRQTKEPIVGLKKISEYVAESNDEMEPHYECALCENQGEANRGGTPGFMLRYKQDSINC